MTPGDSADVAEASRRLHTPDGGRTLTPEQFARVEALFFDARQLPEAQRHAFLDQHAADDPAVRAEVESLLQLGSRAPSTAPLHGQFDSVIIEKEQADVRSLIGRTLGSYHIIDLVGRGGMGIVLLGRDTRLQRLVALKIVPPGFAHDPQRLARFLREARILGSLNHPNIATVYGLEEYEGRTFLVMEYVDGQSLSDRLRRKPLRMEDALDVACQIACGVEAAHDAGVIHRDLKPGNVMCASDGRIKVLDFGLATETGAVAHDAPTRVPGIETASSPLTRQGSVFGTPAYMSPEQVRGRPLDRRTDIFSFGCIFFKCLTGEAAFSGPSDADIIAAIIQQEPDWSKLPKQTPEQVRRIIRRCMAKDPADRYHDMGDVRLDIEEAIEARQWLQPQSAGGGSGRRLVPWLVATGAAIVACGAILAALQRQPVPAPVAAVQRFDLTLPENQPQRDLERLQLAVSPDGQTVAVAVRTESQGQGIWLRSHRDGQWRWLDQSRNALRPFFSPDGQWVGFFRDGALYRHRTRGAGEPIRLTTATNWYGAHWAEAGIAYARAWDDPVTLLDEHSRSTRLITQLNAERGEITHNSALLVSGSRWVLYNAWDGGDECHIHATHIDSGEEHRVIANASSPRVTRTPRGDYLLFERASMIFAAPFDRATGRITGPEMTIVEGVLCDITRWSAYFDVADDGTLIYFPGNVFTEENRLAYLNPDGTTTPFNDDRLSFCEPDMAYDGSFLAVVQKGKLYRILMYDLKTMTRTYLVTGGDTVGMAMSPDSRTIAVTVNREGGYGIDLIPVSGGPPKRIIEPDSDYPSDLDWSRDGRFLTFTRSPSEGVARDMWLHTFETGELRSLVSSPGSDSEGTISPDSRMLAYASDVSGRWEIYLIDLPNGDRRRQVSFEGGQWPTWSPDGRTLYYISNRGLLSVAISEDGNVAGLPTVVYDKPFGQSDPIAKDYTITPDNRVLLIEPSERRRAVTHLNVITNWYQLLTR